MTTTSGFTSKASADIYYENIVDVNKVALFSHDDLDGIMPSLLLEFVYENLLVVNKNCTVAKIDEEIMTFLEREDSHEYAIFVTDIRIAPETAAKLQERFLSGQKVVYIDHHYSNLMMNQYPWATVVVNKTSPLTSATSLLYDYLLESLRRMRDDQFSQSYASVEFPENRTNIVTNLIGMDSNKFIEDIVEVSRKYDTWEWHDENPENRFILSHDLNMLYYVIGFDDFKKFFFSTAYKGNAFEAIPEDYIDFIKVEYARIQRFVEDKAPTIRWMEDEGYKLAVLYADTYVPYLAEYVTDKYPDTDIVMMIDPSVGKVSLRARKKGVQALPLALKYGGGGHPQSCGFGLTAETFSKFVTFQ